MTAGTAVFAVLAATPASAADTGHGHAIEPTSPLAVAVRVLLFAGSAAVAGTAILRPLVASLGRPILYACYGFAGVAGLALFLGMNPDSGFGLFIALPQAALTALVAMMLKDAPKGAAVGGWVLTAAVVVEMSQGMAGVVLALAMVQVAAGVAAVGGVLVLVEATRSAPPGVLRRLTAVAVGGLAVVAALGPVPVLRTGIGPGVALDTWFGRLAVAQSVAAVLALGVIAWHRRRGMRRHVLLGPVPGAVAATLMLVALAASAAVPATASASAAVAGSPALVAANVGGVPTTVAVLPHRPGPNLVWVSGGGGDTGGAGEVAVDGGGAVPLAARPGAEGSWAVVDLPAGASRLWISRDGARAPVFLDGSPDAPAMAGALGADGPECLSAVVAALAVEATAPSDCPSDALTPADARLLDESVTFLAGRGIRRLSLVEGTSPRAVAAAREVRRVAARSGLEVAAGSGGAALLVLSDWRSAEQALRDVARPGHQPTDGVYFAPWLANGTLLKYSTGAVVALGFNPVGPEALRYVGALTVRNASALASPAGFAVWRAATGLAPVSGPGRLYSALAGFQMYPGHEHGSADGWVPGGVLAEVSGPLGP
jgi:hypothetical protein